MRNPSRTSYGRLLLCGTLSLLPCCGDLGSPLIMVSVAHVTPDIKTLVAGVQAGEQDSLAIKVAADTPRFGIWLTRGMSGLVTVTVEGRDKDGCRIAQGSAPLLLATPSAQDLAVSLTRTPRACP